MSDAKRYDVDGAERIIDAFTASERDAEIHDRAMDIANNHFPAANDAVRELQQDREQFDAQLESAWEERDEAKAQLAERDARIAELEAEDELSNELSKMNYAILTAVCDALKGKPPQGTRYSFHDLGEWAERAVKQRDEAREIARKYAPKRHHDRCVKRMYPVTAKKCTCDYDEAQDTMKEWPT